MIVEEFKKDNKSVEFLNATENYHMARADFWKHWETTCVRVIAIEAEIADKNGDKELSTKLKKYEVETFDEISKQIANWYMHRRSQLNLTGISIIEIIILSAFCLVLLIVSMIKEK